MPPRALGLATLPLAFVVVAARSRTLLDEGWKFYKLETPETPSFSCTVANFTLPYDGKQCWGLSLQAQVVDEGRCQASCCGDVSCEVYQWCAPGATDCHPAASCYTGKLTGSYCMDGAGWRSRGRHVAPAPAPAPAQDCSEPYCDPGLRDDSWRVVDLPHDFVVENNFSQSGDTDHGYLPYSIGWYRLHFMVQEATRGKAMWLDFDGVQRDSACYLNGKLLGTHLSGYTPFRYDVSKYIDYGSDNVLAVKVDATAPDGWWYDGGGIYRHVWLNVAEQVHVVPWGVYLPAKVTGEIAKDARADAEVTVQVTIANDGAQDASISWSSTIADAAGATVAQINGTAVIVPAGGNKTVSSRAVVKSAALWSDEWPWLYSAEVALSSGDKVTETFGIRKMDWDVDRGFLLNGKPVKIRGFANHQDFAGVGVAVPDSLQAYRVWQMKQMGANGWRTAHNPPTPALLDECDRQGMLVWDENHRNRDSPDMIDDLKTLILRDRNHPSVIMWSLCNEALCENYAADTAAKLKPIVKELDPQGQRPVFAAMNGGFGGAFQSVLDVFGVNYHTPDYDNLHRTFPDQPMIGSETSSDYSDRYVYQNDAQTRKYVSSYDVNFPQWGQTAEDAWCAIDQHDFIAGGFGWTGFDYKGEPSPYGWPNVNSHFGVIDIAGFPKDNYFYYQSVFFKPDGKPIVHLLPMHWNFEEGKTVDVWAYTNADAVELFLNNKSLGRQAITRCRHVSWKVPFAAGTLRAQAYRAGSSAVFAMDVVETAGAPTTIVLETDWPLSKQLIADNTDTALVTVKVVDDQGRVARSASQDSSLRLSFALAGDGKLIGKGNGDPSNHEPDKPERQTSATHAVWGGLARLVVQSTHTPGTITIRASGPGLTSAEVTINTIFHRPVAEAEMFTK